MASASDRIVASANEGLAHLLARADSHSDADLSASYPDHRVADVLTHLHAWHLLLEGWLADESAGRPVHYPAEGYAWADLEALNEALHRAHRHLDYPAAREAVVDSHARIVELVRGLSDESLSNPAAHPWLDGDTLAAVAHECLGGHYDWAAGVLDRAGVPA